MPRVGDHFAETIGNVRKHTNTITGSTAHNSFVLPKAGPGFDYITGFTETNGDVLDLRPGVGGDELE